MSPRTSDTHPLTPVGGAEEGRADEIETSGASTESNDETSTPPPAGGGSSEDSAEPPESSEQDAAPDPRTEDSGPERPPTRAGAREKKIQDCLKRVETIEDQIRIRSEAGTLTKEDYTEINKLIPSLEETRRDLRAGELEAAMSKLFKAELQSDKILKVRGFRRLLILHHLPILSYYLVVIALVSILGFDRPMESRPDVWGVPVLFIAAGALGACFRGVWWVCRKITQRQFRVWFYAPYLLAPAIGAFLGAVVFLLIHAGAMGTSGADGKTPANTIPTLLAFLAGFSWEWAERRMSAITKSH